MEFPSELPQLPLEAEEQPTKASTKKRNRVAPRDTPLMPGECVVCPNQLTENKKKKKVPIALSIPGLPELFCCSEQCYCTLKGDKIERPLGKKTLARYETWVTAELGTPLRVGDSVVLLRDTSPNRCVEQGPGTVTNIVFDRATGATLITVRHHLGISYTVTPQGLTSETSLVSPECKTPRLCRRDGVAQRSEHAQAALPTQQLAQQLDAAQAALSGQQVVSKRRLEKVAKEKARRVAAEGAAAAASVHANVAQARLGHTLQQTAAEISSFQSQQLQLEAQHSSQLEEASARQAEVEARLTKELEGVQGKLAEAQADISTVQKKARLDVQQLKRQSTQHEAVRHRTEAAATAFVSEASQALSAETRRADEAEARAAAAELEAERLRREVARLSTPSLSSLLEVLSHGGKADALFKKSGGIDSLVTSQAARNPESRQHVDLNRAVNICVHGLLDVCGGGEQDRVDMLTQNLAGALQKSVGGMGSLWSQSKEAEAYTRVCDNLVVAWRGAKRRGDSLTARQTLSLLASRPAGTKGGALTQRKIADLVSLILPIALNDKVRVLPPSSSRNSAQLGVVTAIHSSLDEDDETVVTYDIAPQVTAGRCRAASDFLEAVPHDRVWHVDSLVCTLAEVQAASDHAADFHPGAPVPARKLSGWTRMDPAKNETIANFLRLPGIVRRADAGRREATSGRRWILTYGVPELLRRLNKHLVNSGQTPISRKTLKVLVGGPEYTTLTALKCVCSTCRDLGFVGYELWRQIVKYLVVDPNCPIRKRLLAAIDEEERFRAGPFRAHLKDESPNPWHCLCHLCSAYNQEEFRGECDHPRGDGKVIEREKTMVERVAPRQPQSTHWVDSCVVCAATHGDDSSLLLCCETCPAAAHKKCILATYSDLGTTWTCPTCVAIQSSRQHDQRCLECEGHHYIKADTIALAKYARAQALAAGASTERADWALAAANQVDIDIQQYHAHLVRATTQAAFEPWARDSLTLYEYTDLYDYWAKQQEKRAAGGLNAGGSGVCEGQANIGVSVHGRCWTYRNPPQWLRDLWPAIDWDLYPPPPEKSGPEFLRDFRRSMSNSSTQDSFDTAATKLAEDREFLATHPWLTTHKGALSDGASNYQGFTQMLYDVLNPHSTVKVTSERGEGKNKIDSDNAKEQKKLTAANNSGVEHSAAQHYVQTCNIRRINGVVNNQLEIDRFLAPTEADKNQINSLPGTRDWKVRHTPTNGPVTCWELFSAAESRRQGRAVGFGPGMTISQETLVEKHGLGLLKLPDGSASISYHDNENIRGDAVRSNPGPLLSREQKKAASVAAAATKAERVENKEVMEKLKQTEATASNNSSRLACTRCGAKFTLEKNLQKHIAADCGRHGRMLIRRRQHDACTIPQLMQQNDEDLAEAEELKAQTGLDLVTVSFDGPTYGWTVEAKVDATNDAPPAYTGFEWAKPTDRTCVRVNGKVRVAGAVFEEEAKVMFGPQWSQCYFYGTVKRTPSSRRTGWWVGILYHGETEVVDTPFSCLEVGTATTAAVLSPHPGVVTAVDECGAAAKQLVGVDFEVVSVDGVDCANHIDALTKLNDAATQRQSVNAAGNGPKMCTKVVLRRPAPSAPWRGSCREVCTRPRKFNWPEEVLTAYQVIVKNPAYSRRDGAVYEELKKQFETKLDEDGKCMCPSRKDVTSRMLSDWRKSTKKKRDAAQDSAARKLAQRARAAGATNDDSDDEVVTDDEEDDGDSVSASDDDEDESDDNESADDDGTLRLHVNHLSSVTVSELRRLLRSRGKPELATVTVADLTQDGGTAPSGQARSAAVRSLLVRRLARVLVDEEEPTPNPTPTTKK